MPLTFGKHIRVLVCLFNFGAYIITFQNTDFKGRCLISLVHTVVAGGANAEQMLENIP